MKKIVIGGQAVIEGVLMRAPDHYAVAVRKPNKKITVTTKKYISHTKRNKFLGLPLIRGVVVLFETVVIGSRALTYSANESMDQEDEKLSKKELFLTLAVSIIVALFLFKFLPLLLAKLFVKNTDGTFLLALVDGIIKITVFIGYLLVISMMSDVQTMFQYHGAEHMSVHCYEANKKLNVKNVKKYATLHPRCGTEFLLLVLFISILFYMFIPFKGFWIPLGIRILLLPVIAGVSYEVLRISGKYYKNWFFKIIAAPGMLLQKITTSKPNDAQIEVAIKSLEAALKAELKGSS